MQRVDLLERLVRSEMPKTSSETHIAQALRVAMRIAGARFTALQAGGIEEATARTLVKKGKDVEAAKYSRLARRLDGLRNKWAVLYLLQRLSPLVGGSALATESFDAPIENFVGAPLQLTRAEQRTFQTTAQQQQQQQNQTAPTAKTQTQVPGPSPQLHTGPIPDIVRDMTFVIQGCPSKYVKFSPEGPVLAIADTPLSRPEAEIVAQLAELGFTYASIQRVVEEPTAAVSTIDISLGLVTQAFHSAVREELVEYQSLVSGLSTAKGLTLRRLVVWAQEPYVRLRVLRTLLENVKDQKGGQLARTIERHLDHGDPEVRKLILRIVRKLSMPIFAMIKSWVENGILEDPHHEFFISQNPNVKNEQLWTHKYSIRPDMLPSFISQASADKIMRIGRSHNFIRFCCASDVDDIPRRHVFEYGKSLELESYLDAIGSNVHSQVLGLMLGKYTLRKHFQGLRDYLLLGRGDFVQCLIDLVDSELSKPAIKLLRHSLATFVESAIRQSNALYEDPDVQSRIDVRLLEPSPNDLGWDVFLLDYHVDSPLNTVFTKAAMRSYHEIFVFLWRLRRVEHTLTMCWSRHMAATRTLGRLKPLIPDLTRIQVLRNKMNHFVSNLQHYVMFEVLDSNWHELTARIAEASEIDTITFAHDTYLNSIVNKALLGPGSDGLQHCLRRIFALVYRFEAAQAAFYGAAEHIEAKKQENIDNAAVRTKQGKWGTSLATDEQAQAMLAEVNRKAPAARSELVLISDLFDSEFETLLNDLAQHPNEALRFLSFRLDFSEFYKAKRAIEAFGR